MIRLGDLFSVQYGVNLELLHQDITTRENGYPFVSRTGFNNGISAYIEELEDIAPNPKHTLSVAGGGVVLTTIYHPYEYYSGRDIYVLSPNQTLSNIEMLYYCTVIEANKYRYSYGRQANKTLRDILIPDPTEIPAWVYQHSTKIEDHFNTQPLLTQKMNLQTETWQWFKYADVFDIKNGYYNKKPETSEEGSIPFIGATERNNGITSYHTIEDIEQADKTGEGSQDVLESKLFSPNCITVSNDGSVGYAFYQEKVFVCSHSVNVLYLKERPLTVYIALFLCTLIELEQYRWAYGRKWRPKRMPDSLIKLPVTALGKPDWAFMEHYIQTLPYSASL